MKENFIPLTLFQYLFLLLISKSLNTSVIKDAGFIGSIEDVVLNLKSTLTKNVELSYDPLIESTLSSELKLAVYRIIQEQANNISRHSAATSVGISLQKKQNQLCLTISDNGKGFDSSQISKGAGLKTIRNRVEVMNGELEIITGPSAGCTLKIIVPVESTVN